MSDLTGKSPAAIEGEIARTRAGLGALVEELEAALTPRHLMERGVEMVTEMVTDNRGRIGGTLRDNPLALALIALGVGWLALAGTRRPAALPPAAPEPPPTPNPTTIDPIELPDAYPLAAGDAMAGYAYARPKPAHGNAISAAGSVALDAVRAQASRAGDYAQGARDSLLGFFEARPLTVGALGLLAGAVIGLTLPRTRVEERLTASLARAPVGDAPEPVSDGQVAP